jgi:hypothetical protein
MKSAISSLANVITLDYILASEGVFVQKEYLVGGYEASPALLAEVFLFEAGMMHNNITKYVLFCKVHTKYR